MPSSSKPDSLRAVIYARYSSENQRDASIADQVEICRRYICGHGWKLVGSYEDRAVSGASDHRAAYQRLLADAETGKFHVIVCEALDRLGRRLSDVAYLHDQLEFRSIQLHAANMGPVTTMHVGLLGTMAQLYLSDLREKTRRGQLGRALAGKIPGGKAYGYDLVEGQHGEREINEAEALVIRRIFRDFASGKSPRAIAKALNRDGIPGPDAREWRDTTIRGQVDRGTGILNNALYIGRLEWNRCSYVKNPKTGRRAARPNPRELWEVTEVPELRIVDDALWEAVKRRQQVTAFEMGRDAGGNALNRAHRREFLLSGLLKCGVCGGGYTITAKDRYGCATRRTKGTCDNDTTITRQEIEARVLGALKQKLLTPDLEREFSRSFEEEIARTANEHEAATNSRRKRLETVRRKIAAIITAIEDGNYSTTLRGRLAELEREENALLAVPEHQPRAIHYPRLADLYAEKVADLERALNDPAIRGEAAASLRSLIDRVELRPGNANNRISATLYGDLAQILAFCETEDPKGKLPGTSVPGSLLSVVAGARSRVCYNFGPRRALSLCNQVQNPQQLAA